MKAASRRGATRVPGLGLLLIAILALPTQASARFKDIAPEADAVVASNPAEQNNPNGTGGTLFLSSADPATNSFGDQHAWLRFDLSGQIPAAATVSSAKLRFYVFQSDADVGDDLPLEVVGAADNWLESTLTWTIANGITIEDTTPAAGNIAATATLNHNQAFLWYEVDVTDYVQSQWAGDKKVSLVVRPPAANSAADPWLTYRANAREFGTNTAPRLRLEFAGDWPTANPVTVIHTNDMHSRLSPHEMDFPDADGEAPALEDAGGAAYVAAKVVELKKQFPNSVVIDAGDISEGNPLGDLRGNGGTIDFFQTLNTRLKLLGGRGVDAVVVGNHDVREMDMLDNMDDPDGDGMVNTPLAPNADSDDVRYIAVNLLNEGASVPSPASWPAALRYKPYVTVAMDHDSNGATPDVTVGILGYLTDDSAILTAETEPLIDVAEAAWSDTSPDTVDLKDWVDHLRTVENADIVILLSHIGHRRLNSDGIVNTDNGPTESGGNDPLLGDTGDVAPPDVVVSGHWHTWAKTAWQPNNLNYQTTNVEAASYGQYVGELQLTAEGRYLSATKHAMRHATFAPPFADVDMTNAFNAVSTLLTSLETEYVTDPHNELPPCDFAPAVTGAGSAAEACPLNWVVGYSADDLLLDKDKWFTLSEFPWSGDNTAGEFIADAMVWKARDLVLNADLAIQSGGGIRRDVKAGAITYREVFEMYPWDDDGMVRVQMTAKEVVDYIEGRFVGSSISEDWQVTADDGEIISVAYDSDQNGSYETTLDRNDEITEFDVIISEFMYQNDSWINPEGGNDDTFTGIDPSPEYLTSAGGTSGTPVANPLEIRNSAVEYLSQFDDPVTNAMTVKTPRYVLNTEIAGEFDAVVTMINDSENEPFFEAVFVRLLNALPETTARRNLAGDEWGLDSLVNPDGSINEEHDFKETMLYRSHLGFPDGYLQVGDTLRIRGEFGFFSGNPQFVDQEGIYGAETEFDITGNDPSLALPDFMPTTTAFFNEEHENHLVKFYATRATPNTVTDAAGNTITVYREGGFFSSSTYLPGNTGDCLLLIGVQTERTDGTPDTRRFRLREASVEPTCFPPNSSLVATGDPVVGNTLTLTATVEDLNGIGNVSGGNLLSWWSFNNTNNDSDLLNATGDDNARSEFGHMLDGNNPFDDGYYIAGTDRLYPVYDAFNGADPGDLVALAARDPGTTTPPATNLFGAVINVTDLTGDNFGTSDANNWGSFSGTGVNRPQGTFSGGSLAITGDANNANYFDIEADLTSYTNIGVTWAQRGTASGFDSRTVSVSTDGVNFTQIYSDAGDLSATWTTETAFANALLDNAANAVIRFTFDGATSGVGNNRIDNIQLLSGIMGGSQQFGTVTQVEFFYSVDGGPAISIGVDNNGGDGWSVDFVPSQEGDYEFYSVATDDDFLVEMAPVYADASLAVASSAANRQVPIGFLMQLALATMVLLLTWTRVRRQS